MRVIGKDLNEDRVPKKYQLPINGYQNVKSEDVTKDWIHIDLKGDKGKALKESEKLYFYEVIYGFEDTGYRRFRYKPIIGKVMHKDQQPQLEREVQRIKKARQKYKKTKAYQKELEEKRQRRERRKENIQHLGKLAEEVGLPNNWFSRTMARELRDIREAHQEWLHEALDAFEENYERGGIMKRRWEHTMEPDFYSALGKAISAHRRHKYTSYDYIDKRGMDQDEIDMLKQECAEELM